MLRCRFRCLKECSLLPKRNLAAQLLICYHAREGSPKFAIKNTLIISLVSVLFSLVTTETAKADGAVYPGNLDKPSYLALDKDKYCGHVIEACREYMEAIEVERNPKSAISVQEKRERVSKAAETLMKRIELYPDEINDTYWTQDGLYTSPLYAAVFGNDVQLLQYVLQKGALPFLPDYCYTECEISPELQTLLVNARKQYNILEVFLKAKKSGINLNGEKPCRR